MVYILSVKVSYTVTKHPNQFPDLKMSWIVFFRMCERLFLKLGIDSPGSFTDFINAFCLLLN